MHLGYLFLFLLLSLRIFSQESNDTTLENFIIADEYEKAKSHTLKMLNSDMAKDKHTYYHAKTGFIYLRLGVLDSAMMYSKEAVNRIDETTPSEIKYEAWKSLAYCFTRFGKLDSAVIYTQYLFSEVEGTNNHEMKRYAHTLMGIIHFQNKLFNESLNHYQQALAISTQMKKVHHLKVDYYNIGLAQTALKNYEEGIKSLLIAEKFALEGADKRLLTRIYGTIADNFASQGNDEKRQFYLNKANEIANQIKDEKLLAMGQSHQVEWSIRNNLSSKSYPEAEKIVESIKKQTLPHIHLKNDSMMYVLSKENNEAEKALFYLESFHENKVRFLNENGKKQLAEIEASYQLKNKNLIIEKQNLEVLAAKRVSKITLLITIICFLLLLFYAYSYYKNKKLVHLIYNKEKEKDFQIAKLKEHINVMDGHFEPLNSGESSEMLKANEHKEDIDVTDKKLFDIYQNLMLLLENERLFLNSEISQSVVIKLIGTNKKYLYESISKYSDLNFRGIINRLRINEAKLIIRNRISNRKELNCSTIYSECGFNSNSSFYRTFKTITGITPNEYADEFRKDFF